MKGRAAGAVLVVLATTSQPLASAGTPNPLAEARQAAERASFVGVMKVEWYDGDTPHTHRVTIQAADGAVEVRGASSLMASPEQGRLVQHEDDDWSLLWPSQLAPGPRPATSAKYDLSSRTGAEVAGRPTTEVEVRLGDRLMERLFLDRDTQLLLRRQQYDVDGTLSRSVGFEALTITDATPAPAAPRRASNKAPEPLAEDKLSSAHAAPELLAEGYQRVGIFRRSGVVQVQYSDGLYDLSVFEQAGRLDRGALPEGGEALQVGANQGWRYGWAGGHVVVWESGSTVFTAVSEAPRDQVISAVQSIPLALTAAPSLVDKLRQACRLLVQPLSD